MRVHLLLPVAPKCGVWAAYGISYSIAISSTGLLNVEPFLNTLPEATARWRTFQEADEIEMNRAEQQCSLESSNPALRPPLPWFASRPGPASPPGQRAPGAGGTQSWELPQLSLEFFLGKRSLSYQRIWWCDLPRRCFLYQFVLWGSYDRCGYRGMSLLPAVFLTGEYKRVKMLFLALELIRFILAGVNVMLATFPSHTVFVRLVSSLCHEEMMKLRDAVPYTEYLFVSGHRK